MLSTGGNKIFRKKNFIRVSATKSWESQVNSGIGCKKIFFYLRAKNRRGGGGFHRAGPYRVNRDCLWLPLYVATLGKNFRNPSWIYYKVLICLKVFKNYRDIRRLLEGIFEVIITKNLKSDLYYQHFFAISKLYRWLRHVVLQSIFYFIFYLYNLTKDFFLLQIAWALWGGEQKHCGHFFFLNSVPSNVLIHGIKNKILI